MCSLILHVGVVLGVVFAGCLARFLVVVWLFG
jgi:hypothetical protein